VVLDVRRQPAQDAAQSPVAQPPVIVYLGDGTRTGDTPYQAPAGLFAAPAERVVGRRVVGSRVVGEREDWVS
jgi:hypothetical protein